MNQQLYNQFVDAASMMVVIRKFEVALQNKRDEWDSHGRVILEARRKVESAHKSYGGRTGLGVFFTIFGLVNFFACLFSIAPLALEMIYSGMPVENVIMLMRENFVAAASSIGLIVLTVAFLIMAIIGRCLIVSARRKRKKYKKIIMEELEAVEAEQMPILDKIDRETEQLRDRLRKYGIENDHLVSFLPSGYRNPQAIGFMMRAVENLRADNLTDAINLYEQELHYLEQERILNNAVEMQRIQNENMLYTMESINRNQERINSNLQYIQAMQFISMLDD